MRGGTYNKGRRYFRFGLQRESMVEAVVARAAPRPVLRPGRTSGSAGVDGMVYVNSGYPRLGGAPGNVLLAFGIDSNRP